MMKRNQRWTTSTRFSPPNRKLSIPRKTQRPWWPAPTPKKIQETQGQPHPPAPQWAWALTASTLSKASLLVHLIGLPMPELWRQRKPRGVPTIHSSYTETWVWVRLTCCKPWANLSHGTPHTSEFASSRLRCSPTTSSTLCVTVALKVSREDT